LEIIVIAMAALIASCLTLFSGFGLGTLLMPVVAIFFPVDIAIGITALVHFANNIFKLGLIGLRANKEIIIISFVAFDFSPAFSAITLDKKFLPLGGCISGFFGGMSGNQGAFRSMFLLKAGLDKEQFIATGVVLAVMVDLSRILIYGFDAVASQKNVDWLLVSMATFFAFIGAFVGSRLIRKITIRSIRIIVSVLLVLVATRLIMGIL